MGCCQYFTPSDRGADSFTVEMPRLTFGRGCLSELGELPSPSPGPGEILVGVRACGLNFADTLMIRGKYQERPDFPFSPGLEVSGEVLETGSGVDDFARSPHQPHGAVCHRKGCRQDPLTIRPASSLSSRTIGAPAGSRDVQGSSKR